MKLRAELTHSAGFQGVSGTSRVSRVESVAKANASPFSVTCDSVKGDRWAAVMPTLLMHLRGVMMVTMSVLTLARTLALWHVGPALPACQTYTLKLRWPA